MSKSAIIHRPILKGFVLSKTFCIRYVDNQYADAYSFVRNTIRVRAGGKFQN
jgi:hypothetical protein